MCGLCMKLIWKFHFSNNAGMLQIICVYVTNYYVFVCTVNFLLLSMFLTLVNANISWNITFATIVVFGQTSSGPMDFLFRNLLSFSTCRNTCIMHKPRSTLTHCWAQSPTGFCVLNSKDVNISEYLFLMLLAFLGQNETESVTDMLEGTEKEIVMGTDEKDAGVGQEAESVMEIEKGIDTERGVGQGRERDMDTNQVVSSELVAYWRCYQVILCSEKPTWLYHIIRALPYFAQICVSVPW